MRAFLATLISKPVGVVALLDNEDKAEDASERSEIMDEISESRALGGFRYTVSCETGVYFAG